MMWAGHVMRVGEMRNVHNILVINLNWFLGGLFYGAFSVIRVYSVDDRVMGER
jgi:hypothetical protein